jgi:protein-tyrosine phosphatase
MTVPSFSVIMDIVQIARSELSSGFKIAVHCHAGYGRTGLTIACILISHFKMSSGEAIATVRHKR